MSRDVRASPLHAERGHWSQKFARPTVARQNRPPFRPDVPDDRGEQRQQLNEQRLSERLERVAAHIPAGARLADIGSDHGYLLVALMTRGVIAAAVAGEVALTPFHAAQRTCLLYTSPSPRDRG